MEQFDPRRFYGAEEMAELSATLKADRRAWLSSFEGLNRDIAGVFDV